MSVSEDRAPTGGEGDPAPPDPGGEAGEASRAGPVRSHRSRAGRAVAVVVVAVALVGLLVEVVEDRVFPKRWDVVEEGSIYRSGQLHRALVDRTLREHGIDLIVNLRNADPDDPDQRAEAEAAASLGIEVRRLPLSGDGTGAVQHYVDALEAMVEARDRGDQVLVHCAAGTFRTGVAVGWYRLFFEGWAPEAIVTEMLAHDMDPDDAGTPLRYMNEWGPTVAAALVERGLLDTAPPVPPLPVP